MLFDNKLFQAALTFFGSVIGQLLVRIFSLNGSLDKWWLLLMPISVPPVSFIPAYLVYTNKIKMGDVEPYDANIFYLLFLSVFIAVIMEKFVDFNPILNMMAKYTIALIVIYLAFNRRYLSTCKKNVGIREKFEEPDYNIKNKSIWDKFQDQLNKLRKIVYRLYLGIFGDYIRGIFERTYKIITKFVKETSEKYLGKYNSRSIINALIIVGLLPLIQYLFNKLPYIGSIIETLKNIHPILELVMNLFVHMSSITILYIVINMFEGINIDASCDREFNFITIIVFAILSVVLHMLIEQKRVGDIQATE